MPSVLSSAVNTGPGFDVLAGAIRPVYSQEIRFNALPNLRFPNLATRKEELNGQPGRQINMPLMGIFKRGGRLNEGIRVNVNPMSMSQTSLTVTENGNAIGVTEYLLQTSFYDNMAAASMLLGRDLAVTLNYQLRDIVRAGTNKIYGGNKASRSALTTRDVFDKTVCDLILESLSGNNSPKFDGEYYVVFVTPHQVSTLRQCQGWHGAQLYANTGRVFRGEAGMMSDMRFIESTAVSNGLFNQIDPTTGQYTDVGFDPTLASGAGSPPNQAVIHQAVAVGEYSYGYGASLLPELRDNGIKDFGREHAVMWYSIDGEVILEPLNSFVIETS